MTFIPGDDFDPCTVTRAKSVAKLFSAVLEWFHMIDILCCHAWFNWHVEVVY